MYGLRVPRVDPFKWARQNAVAVAYPPLRLAYGYFARMADGTPAAILFNFIQDPRRLFGTMGTRVGTPHPGTSDPLASLGSAPRRLPCVAHPM